MVASIIAAIVIGVGASVATIMSDEVQPDDLAWD